MSSAPSSPTLQRAAPIAPVDPIIEIGFADDSDADAIELHRFLCVVAQPVLHAPIDPADSMAEVLSVIKVGIPIVARANGEIVGALGLQRFPWYYNKRFSFFADRWFFVFPQFRRGAEFGRLRVAQRMLIEGHAIAFDAGMPLFVTGHQHARGNGITFTRPRILGTAGRQETH